MRCQVKNKEIKNTQKGLKWLKLKKKKNEIERDDIYMGEKPSMVADIYIYIYKWGNTRVSSFSTLKVKLQRARGQLLSGEKKKACKRKQESMYARSMT